MISLSELFFLHSQSLASTLPGRKFFCLQSLHLQTHGFPGVSHLAICAKSRLAQERLLENLRVQHRV